MNMKTCKKRGVESLKSRYGLLFISPWIIGTVFFFVTPVLQSLWFSFCEINVNSGGVAQIFKGLANFREVLVVDPDYNGILLKSVGKFLYSFPIIMILSLVLAIILNRKFRGRIFFRGLFFLSAIIASGGVLEIISLSTGITSDNNVSPQVTATLFSAADIMAFLDLSPKISGYVTDIVNNIFDLVWSCGIQTVLYISGLQTIPSSLYEVSMVEGANKWEQFWFITFPMLSKINLLVLVFTSIELFTDTRSEMIKHIYELMLNGNYSTSSAKLWLYFGFVGMILGAVLLLYKLMLQRRWE